MRNDLVVHPPLTLDRSLPVPLTRQIVTGTRNLIEAGTLAAGDALPSTRALAAELGVARGTVVTAFDQLEAEGYLTAARGSGTHVAQIVARSPGPRPQTRPGHGDGTPAGDVLDLRPGHPDISAVDSPPWRRAWREALSRPAATTDPAGLAALRIEIAEHLRLMRSLVCPPDQVLITAGAREGLTLALGALSARRRGSTGEGPGRLTIGVERPGHPALSLLPAALGHETIALTADDQGLVTDRLPDPAQLDAVIVTPSHQYPHGGVLSARRRQELLAWAQAGRVLVIEDDYDSELRYVGMPLPPLASLDDPEAGCVLTLGTFSTVLSPALATGYAVAPANLLEALLDHRRALGPASGTIVQQALAEYLASGELRRHIQRMRRRYRSRRNVVMEHLADAPGARLAPLVSGLQAIVLTDAPGARVIRAAEDRGVLVGDLAGRWGTAGGEQGIVFGFAGVPVPQLERAVTAIAAACGDAAWDAGTRTRDDGGGDWETPAVRASLGVRSSSCERTP